MKNIVQKTAIVALLFSISFCVSAQAAQLSGKTAMEITKLMGTGWNLGNSLDVPDGYGLNTEISWGNPKTTQSMIDAVKRAGFNTVRIPVSWGKHTSQSGELKYKIDDAWMARVKEVVDYCFNNDMFVILNIHHDNNQTYYYPSPEHQEKSVTFVKDVWTQVAAAFADYDQHLIFETLNEPRLVGTADEWSFDMENLSENVRTACEIINTLNQVAVDAIRGDGSGYNKERMIMSPGYGALINACRHLSFRLPTDNGGEANRIALSMHAYAPYELCLGTSAVTTYETQMKYDIEWHFSTLKSLYLDKGIAVVIGETSVSNKNNLSDRLKWVDCFYGCSKRFGIPCVLWDNNVYVNKDNAGESHGYLDRSTSSWYPDGKTMVDRIMKTLGVDMENSGVEQIVADSAICITLSEGILQIVYDGKIEDVTVFDLRGNCLFEAKGGSLYDLNWMDCGVYVVCVKTPSGISVQKILKK